MTIASAYPVPFDGTNGTTALLTTDGLQYRGGYCTVQDVKDLFINLDNFSKLTTASGTKLIETIIADVSNDLDRALELLYLTPITGTNSIQHINFMAKFMSAAAIFELLSMNAEDFAHHQAAAVAHHEKASQRLDDVIRGVTQLFDAQTKGGGERPLFPVGKAAEWNPEADPNLPITDPTAMGPLHGVRGDPAYRNIDWVY